MSFNGLSGITSGKGSCVINQKSNIKYQNDKSKFKNLIRAGSCSFVAKFEIQVVASLRLHFASGCASE